jgi:hypothetical protein
MSETSTSPEQATADQLKDLLAQLTSAQQSYDVWCQTQPENLEKQRVQWLSIRDRTYLDGDALNAWKAREPGLSEKPEVVAAKRRISELQLELASEQSKLNALVAAGTPFAQYKTAVDGIETMIGGILQRLRKQRLEGVLVKTYGHSNFAKLPRALTDAARLHPSVVAIETFAFNPRLRALRVCCNPAKTPVSGKSFPTSVSKLPLFCWFLGIVPRGYRRNCLSCAGNVSIFDFRFAMLISGGAFERDHYEPVGCHAESELGDCDGFSRLILECFDITHQRRKRGRKRARPVDGNPPQDG